MDKVKYPQDEQAIVTSKLKIDKLSLDKHEKVQGIIPLIHRK